MSNYLHPLLYFTVCERAEAGRADDGVAANLRAVLAGDADQYRHAPSYHPTVNKEWFRLDASRFHHDGDIPLLIVHTNITQQKLAELQATARTEQLETVLDVLQHDLRNPLNIIHGYVEQLATDVDDDDIIEAIQQAVARVTEITDATLSFTEFGGLSETEPLSVGEFARTAWLSVQTADATLVVDESHQIMGDRRLL